MEKPTILAHRGVTNYAPENSLEAIQRTVELGIEGIEIDLRQTQDGNLVSLHDDNLMRVVGRDEKASEIPAKTLRQLTLRATSSNDNKTLTGTIAFLPEILEITRQMSLLNIELKGPTWKLDRLESKLIAPLRDNKMLERVVVSSFYHLSLLRLQRLAPELRTGMLLHPSQMRIGRPGWSARWLKLYSIHPPYTLATRENIAFWKNAGYAVYIWTVNERSSYKLCCEAGVDGVITDIPEELTRESGAVDVSRVS